MIKTHVAEVFLLMVEFDNRGLKLMIENFLHLNQLHLVKYIEVTRLNKIDKLIVNVVDYATVVYQ